MGLHINLIDLIKTDGLNKDEVINEYYEKNLRTIIKNVYNSQSAANNDFEVLCDTDDDEKDDLLNKEKIQMNIFN
ncbi:unnamed protein product [Rotaria sp. Silwood1]|nr:unnamed protein product [Rotaria sp. Silwood1]